jgi:hypothetical protein
LTKRQASPEATLLLNLKTREILKVLTYTFLFLNLLILVAIERGDGRRVDGKRVAVDYERGRTREDWLPRRLGGGKGDTRRNRDEEKIIRDLKKSHPLLREKSRSRSKETR